MIKAAVFAIAVFLTATFPLRADVTLPGLFSNDGMLQADQPLRVWGNASPGEAVAVSFASQTVDTVAGDDGGWEVVLEPVEAGGPHEMVVKGRNTIRLTNIVVGDIWVCGGQSNMQFRIEISAGASEAMAQADHPDLRLFTVERRVADEPSDDVPGEWRVCTPQNVRGFSAVGYYFGREVLAQTGRPVGLISANWGGTLIEQWVPVELLQSDPDYQPILDRYEEMIASGEEMNHTHHPAKLYNAMIHPIGRFAIKGVIFYQGESNAMRADQYRKLFPDAIRVWREDIWEQPDLPFLFVQLAAFGDPQTEPSEWSGWSFPELREAQLMTWQNTDHTAMASAVDVGEAEDIHPKDKKTVGQRLALAAMNQVYGQDDVIYSGPIYREMRVDGSRIGLSFDHIGSGLMVEGGELAGFAIAGRDQKFVWARASIDGDTVWVEADEVAAPVAVRYGWGQNPVSTLYNREGLPASPFRTDDWPVGTTGKK